MALSNLAGWTEDKAASACGAVCGASDKPAEIPAACGAADKPEEKPAGYMGTGLYALYRLSGRGLQAESTFKRTQKAAFRNLFL